METKYIVSALKYRPNSFDEMVGQEALAATLKSAIVQQKTAHAYLFCGPRGVGKTSCARIFARAINCMDRQPNGEACGKCESCRAFQEQRSMNIYELDAASNNSVDDIRLLIEQVNIPPQIGRYKIYIIDEVHMLSSQAFNAFLKTLEEPPTYVIFILATTEKHKILPTILSRCQIFDFKRISPLLIEQHLRRVSNSEGIKAEDEALAIIASKADGGMRDALSLFDRIARFSDGNITYANTIENLNILDYEYYFRLIAFFLQGDYRSVLLLLNELLAKGFDGQVIINGLASFLRDLLMAQDVSTLPLLEKSEVMKQRYIHVANQCPASFLYQSLRILNTCDQQYRQSNGKRLLLELSMMNIAALFNKGLVQPKSVAIQPNPSPAKQELATQQESLEASNHPIRQSAEKQNVDCQNIDDKHPEKKSQEQKPISVVPSLPHSKVEAEPSMAGRFSLRGIRNKKERKEEIADNVRRPEMSESFNEEQLQMAWLDFAQTELSEEIHLKETMGSCYPKLIQGSSSFEVEVFNSTQEEEINRISPQLLNFLSQKLKNTSIQMSIHIAETSSFNRVAVSSEEKMERLKAENPFFDEFCSRLNLNLL